MRLKSVISSAKESVTWLSEWKSGPVQKVRFPLSKQKGTIYSFGAKYRWRTCDFSIGESRFRVLIVMRPDLENFMAWLGEEQGGDMTLLARLEFHGTHPGWHLHKPSAEQEDFLIPGWANQLTRRVPANRATHRRIEYGVTEQNAADLVSKAFSLYTAEERMFAS